MNGYLIATQNNTKTTNCANVQKTAEDFIFFSINYTTFRNFKYVPNK